MNADPLRAAVVVCTLNRPDDIVRCIETVVHQTRKPEQLIVVDAGDLGVTKTRLQTLCEQANVEFVYLEDKPSTTRQRNNGARYVRSDIVFFLDDDSELAPDYIERHMRRYEEDTSQIIGGIAGVPITDQNSSKQEPRSGISFWRYYNRIFLLADIRRDKGTRLKMSNFPSYTYGLTRTRSCAILPSTAVSYRMNVFSKHLFDEHLTGYVMAEDIDLSYRISREYQLLMDPNARFSHKRSAVSRNSVREQEKRRLLFTQYFFQKNLGSVPWHHVARYWALLGLALRYLYLGGREKNMAKFYGLLDGLRAAKKNGLIRFRGFRPGPLEH